MLRFDNNKFFINYFNDIQYPKTFYNNAINKLYWRRKLLNYRKTID